MDTNERIIEQLDYIECLKRTPDAEDLYLAAIEELKRMSK